MYWSWILNCGRGCAGALADLYLPISAITDFFDGYFARIWGHQSRLRGVLDTFADNLWVASCPPAGGFAADDNINGWSVLEAIFILFRDILVSRPALIPRELACVGVSVTQLANWTTSISRCR